MPEQPGLDMGEYREPPDVKRGCERCGLLLDHEGRMRRYGAVTPAYIVSPRGIAHVGLDNGMTHCGKDATGPNWFWPL